MRRFSASPVGRRSHTLGLDRPRFAAQRASAVSTCALEVLEPRRLLAVVTPTNLAASLGYREAPDGATTRAHFTWTDNNFSETGYRVEWSADGVNNWTTITPDFPANSTSGTQELDAGQKYYYRVRAVEGANLSAPSTVVSPRAPVDRVVQLSASVTSTAVRISWVPLTDAISYSVYRKARSSKSWTLLTPTPLDSTATGYTDPVPNGTAYEYQVARPTKNFYGTASGTAYGYVYAGSEIPFVESRGRALLVVDQTQAGAISTQLQQFRRDLVADGWNVTQILVPRDNGDPKQAKLVKDMIQQVFFTQAGGVQSVVLIGHVPVPYSGSTAWDGHPDHVGAWPADAYYGEAIGVLGLPSLWTDTQTTVNTTYAANNNLPGDGKFDQSTLPSAATVPVGRIDFANLPGMAQSFSPPALTVEAAETMMLKRYFDKNHAWRSGQMSVSSWGLQDDHLGGGSAENAWRNFAPLVGASKSIAADWQRCLNGLSYLWSSGMGPGGFSFAQGVVNTTQLHAPDVEVSVVFNLMFGSYFGDWNTESNLLRELLAAPGASLATMWAGAPNWFVHTMGLGETIGQATMLTQNNTSWGPYSPASVAMQGAHVALLGDPTLTQAIARPVREINSFRTVNSGAMIVWQPPQDSGVVGYHVYRAGSADGPFIRLTTNPLPYSVVSAPMVYYDTTVLNPAQRYTYMVRAIKLQSTPSGTYYNMSMGATTELSRISPTGSGHSGGPQAADDVEPISASDALQRAAGDGRFFSSDQLRDRDSLDLLDALSTPVDQLSL